MPVDYLSPAPAQAPQRAGSLLQAAFTPGAALVRDRLIGYRDIKTTGWRTDAPSCFDPAVAAVDYAYDLTWTSVIQQAPVVAAMPFSIEITERQTVIGASLQDLGGRLRALADRIRSAAVAREFWSGAIATAARASNADWNNNVILASQGTNEVQSLSVNGATAGTFTVTFAGVTSAAIAFNATAATVQAALEAMASIGAGNVTVTGGPANTATPLTVTFVGSLGNRNVSQATINGAGLTGGAITNTTTTPGVSGGGANTVTLNGGAAATMYRALGLLEDALGDFAAGALGCLHMTREALATAVNQQQILRDGDSLLTHLGNRVVADAGYTGTSPAGATPAATDSWVYATLRPVVLLSGPDIPVGEPASGSVDRDTNTVRVVSTELAAVLVPPVVYACRVTL